MKDRGKKVVAYLTAAAMACGYSSQSLVAATSSRLAASNVSASSANRESVDESDAGRLVVRLEDAAKLAAGRDDQRELDRLTRLLLIVRIGLASDQHERRELIRSLPVQVIVRDGMKEFIAGGRVRYRVAVPGASSAPRPGLDLLEDIEQPDSSSATSWTASVAPADCEWEGQPDDCATPEEIEDAQILLAQLDAEAEALEEEGLEQIAIEEAWCQVNYCEGSLRPTCLTPDTDNDVYGTNKGCSNAKGAFWTAVAGFAISRGALYYMAFAAVGVSTGGLAFAVAGSVAATVGLVYGVQGLQNCVQALPAGSLHIQFAETGPADLRLRQSLALS